MQLFSLWPKSNFNKNSQAFKHISKRRKTSFSSSIHKKKPRHFFALTFFVISYAKINYKNFGRISLPFFCQNVRFKIKS